MMWIKAIFKKKTDYKHLVKSGAVLLDVRNPNEVKSGGIKVAKNIPLQHLTDKEIQSLKKLDVPVVCVCASGLRSSMAKNKLKASGIEAYNGGAWRKMTSYFG